MKPTRTTRAIRRRSLLKAGAAAAAVLVWPRGLARGDSAKTLSVLTTTTDLRELAEEVGGDLVDVTCITKGPEDPHFVEARPSFIRAAASADALVVTGLDLEVGYEPLLLGDSRNGAIQKGRPGYVDASQGVPPLEVPTGPVDRSMGDVHGRGNPHYLLDPGRAKRAAGTLAAAFGRLLPDGAETFRTRLASFERRVDEAMFGKEVLGAQPARRLENRLAEGRLPAFLEARGLRSKLAGFAARLAPHAGRKVVSYHGIFVYLLHRFHLAEVAKMEPQPGIPPSPRHLTNVAAVMKKERARVVVHASYHDARLAESVAKQAGATAVKLAHMPGAVPDTGTFLATLRHNVDRLEEVLSSTTED